MIQYRYVYLRPDMSAPGAGLIRVNIHFLVGYAEPTLKFYQQMVEQLTTELPFLDADDIRLGTVIKSQSFEGFRILHCTKELKVDTIFPADWRIIPNMNSVDYYWN